MAKIFDLHSINYKQLNAVGAGTVAAGTLITTEETNGFTLVDHVLNDPYALITEAEMVKVAKTAAAINAGDLVYYVNATSNVAAAGDILIGHCQKAALDTDSHVIISFDGSLASTSDSTLRAVVSTPTPLTMLTGTTDVIITLTGGTYAAAVALGDIVWTGTDQAAFYAGTLVRTSDTVVTVTVASGNVGTDNIVIVPAIAQETQATSAAVTQA